MADAALPEAMTSDQQPAAMSPNGLPLTSRAPWRYRYEAGVCAIPLALAPGFLLAALLGVPTPLEPLGESIMQLTPVGFANALLETLGNLARTAALLGAIAICLPISGLLALLAPDAVSENSPPARNLSSTGQASMPASVNTERGSDGGGPPDAPTSRVSPAIRYALIAGIAVALCLPLVLGAAYGGEAVAALVTGLAYAPALWLVRRVQTRLVYRASQSINAPSVAPAPMWRGTTRRGTTRRELVRRTAGTAVTVAGALTLGTFDLWSRALSALAGRGEVIRRLFAFVPPAPRQPGFPVAGEEPEVTSVAGFYRVSKNGVDPEIQPTAWSLRVTGAVERPFSLSFGELVGMRRMDEYVTLRCVDNPPGGHLMSNAYWSGVSLAALLDRAGAHRYAVAVVMRAPDAYVETVPIAAARSAFALLAYGMNGQTLPWRHGGPVRALVPGFFGFKNVKWIESLEVVTRVPEGYWAERGWTAAYIHPIARIDVWHPAAGGLEVGGVAFTGARGVSAVQVRANGGAWQTATLNIPPLSAVAWVQWRIVLPLAPGQHQLTARVVDAAGVPQDAVTTDIYPDGASGLHSVTVTM